MSDIKRVHFETIADKSSSTGGAAAASKTIRLNLKLFEPNAESFPKFNYSTLLHVEKVRNNYQKKKNYKKNVFLSLRKKGDRESRKFGAKLERCK